MMLPRVLAFAASASAFLVVPEITKSRHDEPMDGVFNILPIELPPTDPRVIPPTAQSQNVKIPCAQCPGQDANVHFDISIVDGSRLLYNGFEVFPKPDLGEGWLNALVATAETAGQVKDKQPLSYQLRQQLVDVDEKQGMMLVEVFLGIDKVGDVDVKNMEFKVKLIVDPEWQLYIVNVDVPEKAPACEGLWCEVKSFFGKFKGGMGCHRGGRMGHGRPSVDGKKHDDMGHGTERPHHSSPHSKPHGHHHGHHGHSRVGSMVKDLVSHIIVPVILGLFAGVGVALVAMVLCTFIVQVINLFRRPSNETRIVLVEDEASEKQGLVDGQAPPPQYEEPVEKA